MIRWGFRGVTMAAALMHSSPAFGQPVNRASTAATPMRFELRVENISMRTTLKLAKGGGLDMPLSLGVWAVHTGGNPILTPGKVEAGIGLKGLAEAGMAASFAANLARVPGVRSHGVLDKPMMPASAMGAKAAGMATKPAVATGTSMEPVAAKLVPAAEGSILMAGTQVSVIIEARPGDRLSLAFMLGHSNDGIIGTDAAGIALFDARGLPVSGDVTPAMGLWDAGTEVNEEPGVGRNQGMRQGAPSAGDPERRPVRPMSEAEFGSKWPAANWLVRVTITPVKR